MARADRWTRVRSGAWGWGQSWCGPLVLVIGVGSKCFLIPRLLVWMLVWGAGVGLTYLGVGILMQVTSYNPMSFVLYLWAAVGVGVVIGGSGGGGSCWLLVWTLVWVGGVGCWRGISRF